MQTQPISEETLLGEFPFIHSAHKATHQTIEESFRAHGRPLPLLDRAPRPFPHVLFQDLTKREMQRVLEIVHYAVEASTGEHVQYVLQLMQKAVACPRVIGGVAQLTPRGQFKEFNSVINVSYSNDWLFTYGKQGYAHVDPVLQSFLTTYETQLWQQTYQSTSSAKQCEFVEEARAHGLTHGLTTGLLDQRHRQYASFFSFAGGDAKETQRYQGLVEYITPYLHRVLMANTQTPLSNRVHGLSEREVSVLKWLRQGKTNWEIGRILGISERTIRFHVQGIFDKLGVTSRTQAVALAFEEGFFNND